MNPIALHMSWFCLIRNFCSTSKHSPPLWLWVGTGRLKLCTLWFQLEDTGISIGTLLLFDPVLFPIYEAWLLIGSMLNFEAFLGHLWWLCPKQLFGFNLMSHGPFKLKHFLKDLIFVFKKSKYDRKIYGCWYLFFKYFWRSFQLLTNVMSSSGNWLSP